jgi:sugar phosphate isomerase/epimerase
LKNKNSNFSRREFIQTSVAAGLTLPLLTSVKGSIESNRPICIFSKHLQWCKSFDEMAEIAADIGFDGVDLTVRKGGHVLPEEAIDKLPQAVKAVEKAGLKVYMMTAGINNPEDKTTVPVLKTASELGIGYYRMGYLSYDKDLGVAKSLLKLRAQMTKLAVLNKKYDIHGAYQNHAGTRVGGPVWDIWELIKDLDPKWIGCQYDIRHAIVEGGTSWPLGLELLQNHIKIIAIKDFLWKKDSGKWRAENVPLGEGMVNFENFFKIYHKYQISGPISLHYEYPLGGADRGRREITISKNELINTMKRDLNQLKSWMKNVGV